MIEVEIPELFGAERTAWHVVLDVANSDPPRWVLATTGQRKHLRRLLAEIEARPHLANGDHDLVIDTLVLLTGT